MSLLPPVARQLSASSPNPRIETWYGLNITSCFNQLGAWETQPKSSWEHYELLVGQWARPHLAVYLILSSTFLCESVQTCSFLVHARALPHSCEIWTIFYKEDTEWVKKKRYTCMHTLGAEQKETGASHDKGGHLRCISKSVMYRNWRPLLPQLQNVLMQSLKLGLPLASQYIR